MTFKRKLGKKAYELKDHLGNVRVTFSDIKMPTGSGTQPFMVDLLSKSEYYPYGMKINDLSYNATGARYGYNGTHEQDLEVNADGNYVDFGNFGYDTRVAMRRNQEPLSGISPNLSTYSIFNSNPITYKDDNGYLFIIANGYRFKRAPILNESGNFNDPLNLKVEYWGNFDNMFLKRHYDENAVYVNGSSPEGSSVEYREKFIGEYAGRELLSKLKDKKIKLKKGETIKLLGHSQGVAVNAGIIKVLLADEWFKANHCIEVFYAVAPKQPLDIKLPKGDYRIVQYSSSSDIIAPQDHMKDGYGNLVERYYLPEKYKDFWTGGHSIYSYGNVIFTVPSSKKGYVGTKKPCKCDTPLAPSGDNK